MKKAVRLVGSKPFIIGAIIIVLILSAAIIVLLNKPTDERDASGIDYRTDVQPLLDRFPTLPAFQRCWWKADTIGRTASIGPTNYWMEGFIVLDEASLTQLDAYSWKPVRPEFPAGLDPAVTGFSDFSWCTNKEFEAQVRTAYFIGDFCFDKNNGILYFSLESN